MWQQQGYKQYVGIYINLYEIILNYKKTLDKYLKLDYSWHKLLKTGYRRQEKPKIYLVVDMPKNNLKKIREDILISKAELARKAGISPLTIDRIENGYACRVDTKRKIIQALGLKLSEKDKVFKE